MELKKASLDDLLELKQICIDAYSMNFHDHWNENGLEWYLQREFSQKKLNADLNNEDLHYYFINVNETSVGFVKIRKFFPSDLSIDEYIELEKIYVLPKYKGMGIGEYTLREIIKITEKLEKKILFLNVIDTNQSAIIFYERLGFKFHSKTRLEISYFKDELRGMNRMCLDLN